MSLDFPATPNDGDTYTSEGTTWQYNADPGLWTLNVSAGPPPPLFYETFIDPTGSHSYQMLGNWLRCWGRVNMGAGTTHTFPKGFADVPFFSNLTTSSAGVINYANVAITITPTTFKVGSYNTGGTSLTSGGNYIAMGKWDGVS